jgi:hypothetical protein
MRHIAASTAVVAIFISVSSFSIPAANAMTTSWPAAARGMIDDLTAMESIHCRPYLHRHPWHRGLSRGCGPGAVVVGPRRPGRVVIRDGRPGRAGVTVRQRGERTTIRGTGTVRTEGRPGGRTEGRPTVRPEGTGSRTTPTAPGSPAAPAAR